MNSRTGTPEGTVIRAVAFIATATITVPMPHDGRISVGSVIALLMIPSAWKRIKRYPDSIAIVRIFLLCAGVGTALAGITLLTSSGAELLPYQFLGGLYGYANIIGSIIATTILGIEIGANKAAAWIGLTMTLVTAFVITEAQQENPWKYAFAWPVSILVLSTTRKLSFKFASFCAIGLSLYSLAEGTRNTAGTLLLAAIISITARRSGTTRAHSRMRFLSLALSALLVFTVISRLLTKGYFGEQMANRQESQEQVWLLGARIEPFATLGYFIHRPIGYGLGIIPPLSAQAKALDELARHGVETGTLYVQTRLVGTDLNLHSILATIWLTAGPLALLVLAYVGRTIFRTLRTPAVRNPAVTFMALQSSWDFFFSPMEPNGTWFGISMALMSMWVASPPSHSDPPEARQGMEVPYQRHDQKTEGSPLQ